MILNKQKVAALLSHLAGARDVFVPARVDGVAKFARYEEGITPDFDMVNTTMPPKDLLFPQTQKMYHFDVDENGSYHIHEYDESREQVVFGIRPCDMCSIVCLDEVFLTKGFVDEFYFYFKKRSQNDNNRPTKIVISASKNGMDYVDVATIEEGLPTDPSVIFYQSDDIKLDGAYKYIRFTVPSTNNGAVTDGHVFFTFSEFYILQPNDLITAASEYYGIATYKDLLPSDVEAIKALDKQIKAIGDGINDVNAGFSFDDAAVYDLSGRKVTKAQKGIYIVNGKKVMVK